MTISEEKFIKRRMNITQFEMILKEGGMTSYNESRKIMKKSMFKEIGLKIR